MFHRYFRLTFSYRHSRRANLSGFENTTPNHTLCVTPDPQIRYPSMTKSWMVLTIAPSLCAVVGMVMNVWLMAKPG
jgi:hypothetical protein